MRKILREQRIIARDQNKVFFEFVSARTLPPKDAENRYGLYEGRGRAYVEFDMEEAAMGTQYNKRQRIDEHFVIGNVELQTRNPQGHVNF